MTILSKRSNLSCTTHKYIVIKEISFIHDIYKYKKIFRDIEKLSKKCVHLTCDINLNETSLNNEIFLNIATCIYM